MTARANSNPTNALYLYGVSAKSRLRKLRSAGVDGVHPVQAVTCGDFHCWVSSVDAVAFSDAINRNMENLDWLALHRVRHQQVVGEIAAKSAVIPARFGTVFSSEEALLSNVTARKRVLKKVLAKVNAADEWGVKVFAEPQPAPPAMTEAKSGKDYLQQKAARMKKRPERSDEELTKLARSLAKVAKGAAPTGKVSGAQNDLLWQATFLLPRALRKQLDRVLKKFLKRWDGVRRRDL